MRDTIAEIAEPLENTYGLVLCGGNSIRMGSDKSMLQYYGKPQRYHVYEMLQLFCEKVFISGKASQENSIIDNYHFIADLNTYNDIGPMAALLSAFCEFPKKNFLVVGCDYPFINSSELKEFVSVCHKEPVGFYDQETGFYEPLLAWYPFSCYHFLRTMYAENQYSLQRYLQQNQVARYIPQDRRCLKSVDTKKEFLEVRKLINAE